ncbi:hypothetical protein EJ05DRAFT_497047 [Pseudovirgaria hyperparasitica]|uniref:NACHT domain-containing protein n=1 Tax=Pseudovirgaria hyperparasitica TaxID=470096 RepID=A0A6A6WHA0_9PEZI|nr:uncharacterized protein EJ05DRAFT_497047 [Pseudovirgaria hyperparasitica]KAF2762182.1 hypothetical protein EJ05DRAFT_497047 [Pseudovirgaria hyperparasitica]
METVVALGLAANICQFVECTIAVIKDGKSIYDGVSGLTKEYDEVQKRASRLAEAGVAFRKLRIAQLGCQQDDKLIELTEDSIDVANGLYQEFERLKGKSTNRVLQAAFGLVKSYGARERIEKKVQQLKLIQQDITSQGITVMLSDLDQIKQQMKDDKEQSRQFQIQQQKGEASISEQISVLADSMIRSFSSQSTVSQSPQQVIDHINTLQEHHSRWKRDKELRQKRYAALRSLQFHEMMSRKDGIKNAHTKDHDDGIFWISGIPGSGKSVLMKSLIDGHQTEEHLLSWAGGARLVIASHYFWATGPAILKSENGMLRSLLFEIFRSCPELVDKMCPASLLEYPGDNAADYPWSLIELRQSIQSINHLTGQYRFCFFIDGLDEYDDASEWSDESRRVVPTSVNDIIEIVRSLTCLAGVKVCVSSRPWVAFDSAYGQRPTTMISLEEFNWTEIRKYTKETILPIAESLRDNPYNKKDYYGLHKIIEYIMRESKGAFLWVYLVVNKVVVGLRHKDSIDLLTKRVKNFPSDLPGFYKHMLDNMDPDYAEEARKIISVALYAYYTGYEPLHVLQYSYIWSQLDTTGDFGLSIPTPYRCESGMEELIKHATNQFLSRCPDFFHVKRLQHDFPHDIEVRFIHRTVAEFIREEMVISKSERNMDTHFDVSRFLANSFLACVKTMLNSPLTRTLAIRNVRGPRAWPGATRRLKLLPARYLPIIRAELHLWEQFTCKVVLSQSEVLYSTINQKPLIHHPRIRPAQDDFWQCLLEERRRIFDRYRLAKFALANGGTFHWYVKERVAKNRKLLYEMLNFRTPESLSAFLSVQGVNEPLFSQEQWTVFNIGAADAYAAETPWGLWLKRLSQYCVICARKDQDLGRVGVATSFIESGADMSLRQYYEFSDWASVEKFDTPPDIGQSVNWRGLHGWTRISVATIPAQVCSIEKLKVRRRCAEEIHLRWEGELSPSELLLFYFRDATHRRDIKEAIEQQSRRPGLKRKSVHQQRQSTKQTP